MSLKTERGVFVWTVHTTSLVTCSAGVLLISRTTNSTLNYKFFRLSFLFDEFPLIGRNAMTYGSSRADPHRYGVQTSNL